MSDLLNKASLVMVPSGYKEDTVYSVVPSDGSGDLSFTRASNGTRVNSAGLVEVAPWNLVLYSEDFSNGVWTTTSTTITADNTTAPNGTATADKVEISSSSNARVQQIINSNLITGGLPCTFSVYIKSVSGTGNVGIRSGQTGLSSVFSYTNQWQRFEWTFNAYALSEIMQFCNNTLVGGADSAPSFFVWGAQLNIGSTAKSYFPTTDRLNVPRLTYQNGGGGCPSLLLEKQSTNLILQSEAFDSASWAPFTTGSGAVNRIANAATSPDGTTNADEIQLTRSALTDAALLYQQQYASNATYSRTIYLKAARSQDVGKKIDIWSYDGSSVLNPISPTLTADWQRIDAGTATGALVEILSFGYLSSNTLPTTSGTDVRFYAWGAQGEASSYPTSYIPTTSSSATRVRDAVYKTGISSLIGQTAGTIFLEMTPVGLVTTYTERLIKVYGGGQEIGLQRYADSRLVGYGYLGGASNEWTFDIANVFTSTTQSVKIAMAYASNDVVIYVNGVQKGTDSSASMFSLLSAFTFAEDITGDLVCPQNIKQAVIFKSRLTNAELASITTI